MTTFEDITHIAAKGESEAIEFKASTGQRTEAARTLSAMLNGRGGRVIFGIQPTGKVTGQEVGSKTLEDITNACQEIKPRLLPEIERISLPDCSKREILAVTAASGANKPYSHKGNYYMRSGAATTKMPDETQISLLLERAHGTQRWETEKSQRDLDSIDDDEVCAFRDDAIAAGRAKFESGASVVEVLLALHLLDDDGRPNRGAVALFGRADALASQYPTLGCRLVTVGGTELGEEFRDDVLVEANAFASLRRAMAFCDEHLHRPVQINGGLQAEVGLEIPRAAVREALANAFGHRDYSVAGLVQVRIFSDRLEVWSPGGLHFGLTPADLYEHHSSHPWNPNMVSCLYRRGIVEQLGSGTLRIARMCTEKGLGHPVFASNSASVTCSIPRRGYWLRPNGTSIITENSESAILAKLANEPMSRGRLAAQVDVSPTEIKETLLRLRTLGLVRIEGHGRGAQWKLSNPTQK
ncbi:MAG: hypothetical protein F4138_05365 [Acidimicrobiia bacterium]|nr:hypothetical protein [Acidimicrobiia bacterium]